jgi:hypothetical protein
MFPPLFSTVPKPPVCPAPSRKRARNIDKMELNENPFTASTPENIKKYKPFTIRIHCEPKAPLNHTSNMRMSLSLSGAGQPLNRSTVYQFDAFQN